MGCTYNMICFLYGHYNENYQEVAFFFFFKCTCVYTQGEKGEPGFVISADGSMMSGLPGPVGPKGFKVILHFLDLTP